MNFEQNNIGLMGHMLTLRMNSVVDRLKDRYAALYNKRDFILKINYMRKCDRDEVGSFQTELIHMFNMLGINLVIIMPIIL